MWTYIIPPLSHSKYTIIGNPKIYNLLHSPQHVFFLGPFFESKSLREFLLRSKFLSDVGNEVASNQTRYLKFLEPLQLVQDYVTYVTMPFIRGS